MNTQTGYRFGEVYKLADQIGKCDEKVVFKNILETDNGGVALVSFSSGQKLDEHIAPAEVMISVLEGEIEFTMAGKIHVIHKGEFLLMGQDVLHSVVANTDAKLMLVKVKP